MKKTGVSSKINLVCSLLFAVFVFLYLLFFQGDLLFYAQHVLSDGMTVYNPLIGAVILTTLALLMSFLSSRTFTRNFSFLPALHYMPSALIIAALTDIHIVGESGGNVFGKVWVVSIVLFTLLVIVNSIIKGLPMNTHNVTPIGLMRSVASNMFAMFCITILIVALGNTDEKDHLRLHAEMLLTQNRFEEASEVGKVQYVCSEAFTMIRAYALGEIGEIGERFFEYPVVGDANSLLPSKKNALLILPAIDLYKFIGGIPSPGMDARECIRLLAKRNKLNDKARDYKYLSRLIDRDLDGFVGYLKNDSVSVDSLPKHYREALTLYNHLRTVPTLEYSSPEMDTDFKDFQDLLKKNPNKVLRENAMRDSYGNTYWFYYYSAPKTK